ncbi:hypothetical protein D3C81_1121600 [compost metagenome]
MGKAEGRLTMKQPQILETGAVITLLEVLLFESFENHRDVPALLFASTTEQPYNTK